MTTRLDQLLQEIDPVNTLDNMEVLMGVGLNTFKYPTPPIRDCPQLDEVLTQFTKHMCTTLIELEKPIELPAFLVHWPNFLERAYGKHAYRTAIIIAETSTEGGIYEVLKRVARQMADKYSENLIGGAVSEYWEENDLHELMHNDAFEYLRKYAHIIPEEYKENNGVLLRYNFREVLMRHPYFLKQFRSIGEIGK